MARVPFNPRIGSIKTDAGNFSVDRAFLARYHIPAAQAAAESDDGVLKATDLDAVAKTVTLGLSNPAVPRNLKVKGNASGINNKMTIHGTNFAGEEISEEFTPNGTTAVAGALAFKAITKIDLPESDHAEVKQKTTSVVTAVTAAGTATLLVEAAILGADGIEVDVVLGAADVATPTAAATAIKNALNADLAFAEHFVAMSSAANVLMETRVAAPQDATVDLTVKTAGGTGLAIGTITVNTVAGVRDRISVGWGKKFGIPYRLTADELVLVKLFNNSADAGTVTADAADLEKNVLALNGTPDGAKPIDLYILV